MNRNINKSLFGYNQKEILEKTISEYTQNNNISQEFYLSSKLNSILNFLNTIYQANIVYNSNNLTLTLYEIMLFLNNTLAKNISQGSTTLATLQNIELEIDILRNQLMNRLINFTTAFNIEITNSQGQTVTQNLRSGENTILQEQQEQQVTPP